MAQKQKKMKEQYELEQEKGRLIDNRIEAVIQSQERIHHKFMLSPVTY